MVFNFSDLILEMISWVSSPTVPRTCRKRGGIAQEKGSVFGLVPYCLCALGRLGSVPYQIEIQMRPSSPLTSFLIRVRV